MKNETLRKFLALKDQISLLEKEVDSIKNEIIEIGSFETSEFVVLINKQTQFRTVDANTLCEVLDPVLVAEKNLIKKIEFDRVSVKKKK